MMINSDDLQISTTICFHHNDADGRASAAILRHALGPGVYLFEINYGDPVPWSLITKVQEVVILDFSFPWEIMEKIAENRKIVWIDHHKSALNSLADLTANWPGIRDNSEAACVLTWQYYFPRLPIPEAVVWIGDRDIWRWAASETGPFTQWLYYQDTHPANDELWSRLFKNDKDYLDRVLKTGEILRETRLIDIRRQVTANGFPVIFEGSKTLAINARGNGDIGAYIRELGYELGYCYVDRFVNGRLMTFVTLFSDQVDVSIVAQGFGGGGHAGAAGFSFIRGSQPFPEKAQVEIL